MGTTQSFNRGWAFQRGDWADAQLPDYDDRGWRQLDLPHDWAIEGPFEARWASATGYLPGGIGWYRKRFTPPPQAAGQRLSIHFDGVCCNSDVWLNGRHLGHRPSGFAGFRYDLSEHLLADQPNLLAVRVDHSSFADARWYTGSGIYRNVWLISAGPLQIAQWGVFAQTTALSGESATLRVAVELQSHLGYESGLLAALSLRDPQGREVARVEAAATLPAGGARTVEAELHIAAPQPWSVERPQLYALQTELMQNGQVVDSEVTPVGLRSIRFDPDQGFFLNGQSLKLKGVCVHDDAGALGVAVPIQVWERRLRTLMESGVNAIRMAHNPHMPELYALCDRLGLLVQDEAFDEWALAKNKWVAGWNVGEPVHAGSAAHFAEWGERDLADMVRSHRNHPSIIMWSIGNEIDYPNDPYSHEALAQGANPQIFRQGHLPDHPHASELTPIARRLAALVRRHDPTRPVTAGLASALIANALGLADVLDVVGYNYQEYRYPADHAAYPRRALYGSENGMQWAHWRAVADNPYIAGQFLWTGIDYLGEAAGWPTRSNGAGLLDLAGFKKPEFYYRQSLWTSAPMIYIGTAEPAGPDDKDSIWRHKHAAPVWAGRPGEPVVVRCFTNCEAAELWLNGFSLGVRRRADAEEGVLAWELPFEPGELVAAGMRGGAAVCRAALRTSGPPAALLAEVDRAALWADRAELAHVAVTLVDAQGGPVYGADALVRWQVEGPARLLGIESGDHQSHEPYQAAERRLFRGRQLGYLQASGGRGPIRITLSAPGLAPLRVALEAF